MSTYRESVLFTKDQLIDMLVPIVTEKCAKELSQFIRAGIGLAIVHYENLTGKSSNELIEIWCELCSDDYFKKNPRVCDVLFEYKDGAMSMKEWMCSFDDHPGCTVERTR